jgi:GntR family transcriptional repressor for pyruvate dehydrogenase complex
MRIHEQIVAGTYPPGTKLPHQRDLATSFGVSAAVTREALARLKAAGLVRTKSGQGTFVTDQPLEAMRFPTWVRHPVGPRELAEAIEARDVLEHATAMRAAQRRTTNDVKTLQSIMGRMAHAGNRADAEAFIASDIDLHLTVAAAAGNQVLTGALSALQRSLRETVAVGVQDAIDNDWMPELIQSHARLVDAIAGRDPIAAGVMMDVMFMRLRSIAGESGISVDLWPRA